MVTQCTLKFLKVFTKIYDNARSTRAGKQNIDLSFWLTARETVWCVFYGGGLVDKTMNLLEQWRKLKTVLVKFSVIDQLFSNNRYTQI